eukprot:Gregarina_sp_Poly_1__5184@NODE_274_length_10212_cov_70_754460_g239_i0_p3_GENE_NODE_274_length_10212_cov_70_754460_g239_i0NODE_274_length_10212_cov_70_754460_g239_i0_p3_ORF_typecomplete_len432_score38_02Dus/PF01207_17/3_6e55DHO_dh/PF01180_21/0_00019_NODE_274_length_10212_cov_70_754460_g239_i069238218
MKRKLDEGSFILQDRLHPDPLSGPNTKFQKCSQEVIKVFDISQPLVQIAPMLHVTTRHFRMFMRQLSTRCQLWTEMVVGATIKHTQDLQRHLGHSDKENPLVCQIGGSDADILADGAEIVEKFGYHELNLNVGCPSSRVVDCGEFGAVLMKNPAHVRDLCLAIRNRVQIPLTVKTRIAVDELDSLDWCRDYISTVSSSGVNHFVMHARPAWLNKKLSPAQNRSIPPLNFDRVFDLIKEFPDLSFSINGGIQSLDEVESLLRIPHPCHPQRSALVGCMIGRAASDKPAFLADVDRRIYGDASNPQSAFSRYTVLQGYMDYLSEAEKSENDEGCSKNKRHIFPLLNPCVGLFHSTKGSKLFRKTLDSEARRKGSSSSACEVLSAVVRVLEEAVPDVLHAPLEPSEDSSINVSEKENGTSNIHKIAAGGSEVNH